mmetsp:Transcript_3427/g.7129  ORF Transcript_3427/g.7129 Transcript_3427/m.7129 type:complete len:555 (+) Transcript_3427:304-1968(+)
MHHSNSAMLSIYIARLSVRAGAVCRLQETRDGGARRVSGKREHALLANRVILGGGDGLDRDDLERLRNGECPLCRALSAREGEEVGPARALHVKVHAADVVGENVEQRARLGQVGGEDRRLLPKSRLVEVGVDVVERREGRDRAKRAELLLMPHAHLLAHRVEYRRPDEGTVLLLAQSVDHLGALGLGILDQLAQVARLARLGQRRQLHAAFPRQTHLHLVNRCAVLLRELRSDGLVDEHELEGRASLAVIRERAGDALGDGAVEVAIRHHDGQVLRVERQARFEPVRLGVRLHQCVCRLRTADEREDVDLARLHDRRHCRAAGARDEVDHTGGEHPGVHLHRADVREAADVGQLHHHRVAHQQRRNQRAIGLVEGVVERAHVEHHADWPALDLSEHAADLLEGVVAAKQLAVRVERALDVVHRPIKLLSRISRRLANFPHQHVHNLLAVLLELDDELLDLGDAVRRRGERPRAASVVPAGGGGVESGERVRFGHARLVADQDLLLRALLEDRRVNFLNWAFPIADDSVAEDLAAVNEGASLASGSITSWRRDG